MVGASFHGLGIGDLEIMKRYLEAFLIIVLKYDIYIVAGEHKIVMIFIFFNDNKVILLNRVHDMFVRYIHMTV